MVCDETATPPVPHNDVVSDARNGPHRWNDRVPVNEVVPVTLTRAWSSTWIAESLGSSGMLSPAAGIGLPRLSTGVVAVDELLTVTFSPLSLQSALWPAERVFGKS